MTTDGRAIAEDIKHILQKEVQQQKLDCKLGVVYAGANHAIESFIKRKKEFGEAVGIAVEVFQYPSDVAQEVLAEKLSALAGDPQYGGIVVQLPLPAQIEAEMLINLVPAQKDIDVLSRRAKGLFEEGKSPALPPVVGAIKEVAERAGVDLSGKEIVIVGEGKLVGKPVYKWLVHEGYTPMIVGKDTPDMFQYIKKADVLVLGAGVPGLIKPEHVKEGVAIFDAGTSEEGGKVKGDADPSCAEKAAVFTPVPGGIGPLTVAMLFRNMIELKAKGDV